MSATVRRRRRTTEERIGASIRHNKVGDLAGRGEPLKRDRGAIVSRAGGPAAGGPGAVYEHVTALVTAGQSLASGGAPVLVDRVAGPPTERLGFRTFSARLAADGEVGAIPIDETGVLLVDMWLRLADERELTWSGEVVRSGSTLEVEGASGTGDQVDARYKRILARADDTFAALLTHESGGALWGDPTVLWGDPDVLWGSGGLVIEEGWIDLTLLVEASSTGRPAAVPTPTPTLTTADVQQPNVDGRAVDVAGACLTLSGLSDVPTVEYTRSTSFDAGAFNLATEIDVNMPLGHGGTLVALVMCSEEGHSTGMSADDAGWTKVIDFNSISSVFDIHGGVWTKDGDGTEGASQQFSTDDPARMWNAVVLRVAGVDAVDAASPVYAINQTANPSLAQDVPAPSPATNTALALWAAMSSNSGQNDAGLTVVHDGAEELDAASVGTTNAFWNAALWGAEVTIP